MDRDTARGDRTCFLGVRNIGKCDPLGEFVSNFELRRHIVLCIDGIYREII
jgi:hypothetical protein